MKECYLDFNGGAYVDNVIDYDLSIDAYLDAVQGAGINHWSDVGLQGVDPEVLKGHTQLKVRNSQVRRHRFDLHLFSRDKAGRPPRGPGDGQLRR